MFRFVGKENEMVLLSTQNMCLDSLVRKNEMVLLSTQNMCLDLLVRKNEMVLLSTQNILKAKSNFTLLLYIPFLGIGEWYFKCV